MKKKFEFDNVFSLNVFDDIKGEIKVKYPDVKFFINKEKFYFIIECDDCQFDEYKHNILDIVKYYIPNIDISEKEAEEVYRKIVYLENLDCANCAAKVERLSKRTFNHERIIVDFATTRFIIETTDLNLVNNIEEELFKITRQVDANIKPRIHKTEKQIVTKPEEKVNKFFVMIGGLIYAISLILHYIVFNHTCADGGFNPSDLSNVKVQEHLILIIMYAVCYILLGFDVILGAIRNIKSGRVFDEKFLMTIATIMAFLVGSYTEAVTVMIFYKIGELLTEYAVNKSRKSINSLMNIKADTATVIVEDKEIVVSPEEIVIDDIIIVKPGERIPLDGIIIEGEASLDTSALTGESKFFDASVNDKVLSGSICINGFLKIKVTKLYNESMVSKIVDMVSNASLRKANTENIVSKFARYYTPIVCGLSILIIIINLLFVHIDLRGDLHAYLRASIYPAMIFLVVSCPCALIISVPLGFFGGIGSASKKGILVKGSNYLENLRNVGIVVFDKTGTLTKGHFFVKEIQTVNIEKEKLLEIAAYCELGSIHPVAKSIVEKYGRDNIDSSKITYLPSPSKKGNIIKLNDDEVAVGNKEYMKTLKIKVPKFKSTGLIVYVAINNQYEGYIILEDEIREESFETVKQLKELGIDVAMLSGDTEDIAWDVANQLGIQKVYANMNPIDKVRRVRKLKKNYNHKKIVFVGDGMNDAPVLSCADVGIAMGGLGSDAAIDVADIVLMTDDLTKLIDAIKISRRTVKIVYQNIIFSLAVKGIVLLGAVVLPQYTKMWEGVFADVGVSLIAVINSMRVSDLSITKIFKPQFDKIFKPKK